MLGVEGENGGMASSIFNSSEITWTGSEVTEEIVNRRTDVRNFRRNGRRMQTTTVTGDIVETITERGTEAITQLEVTPSNEQFSLGERVIDINVLHNVRSRNIEVVGKKLKQIGRASRRERV